MEWTTANANSLLAIDEEVGKHHFLPAEYEIIRRVILETADFDYLSHIHFSEHALSAGAGALGARSPIVVDIPRIKAGIANSSQNSFANPIYSCLENHSSYKFPVLAKRYPEAIFIIGQEQTAVSNFVELLEQEEIKPAFAIITAPKLIEIQAMEKRLESLTIPHIRIKGRKGNTSVAVSIVNGLIDLAWQVYRNSFK